MLKIKGPLQKVRRRPEWGGFPVLLCGPLELFRLLCFFIFQ